jgi:hypothetical protein
MCLHAYPCVCKFPINSHSRFLRVDHLSVWRPIPPISHPKLYCNCSLRLFHILTRKSSLRMSYPKLNIRGSASCANHDRRYQVTQTGEDRKRCQLARTRVARAWRNLDTGSEPRNVGLDMKNMRIKGDRRVRPDFNFRSVRSNPGKGKRCRNIGICRKSTCGLPRGT